MTGDPPLDLQTVCDAMADGLLVVDGEGRVAFVNRRVLEALGRSRKAVLGNHVDVFEARTVEGFDAVASAVDAVLAGRADERRVDATVESSLEGRLAVEVRVTPLEDGALVLLRDVSERKCQEAEAARRSEQLAVLNRLVRHDIRNDANVIAGWSEELADELADPDLRAAVDHVRDAATHIEELTREARDVHAIIDDQGEMERSPVALDRVLREEIEKARGMHPHATFEVPTGLPSVTVEANELLGSVVANLLNNAVVHNTDDEPLVAVRVDRADGAVVVTVADDGPGVPPERRGQLFDRGERGLASSGSGMGLYIVATLVEEFGGTVAVEDADLGGAAFTVRLPVADDG